MFKSKLWKLGNKFHAKPVVVDGQRFASQKEYRRYRELLLQQKAGIIRNLKRQVRFKLEVGGIPIRYETGRQAVYVADFTYAMVATDWSVIEDAKGMMAQHTRLKLAIMAAMGHKVLLT